MPKIGDFVICKIKSINPNSAFAVLVEYESKPEGMIHISEINRGWVRDIRKFIKEGQQIVAKVIRIDRERGHITLSRKRVDNNQKSNKLREYKLEQKSEKMLEMAAKKIGGDIKKIQNKIGNEFQENFGLIYEGFKIALKNPDILKKLKLNEKEIEAIVDIAKKNMESKDFEFRAELKMQSLEADGIEKIKDVLMEGEKIGLNVTYITAPRYLVKYKTRNAKKGKKEFEKKLEEIVKLGNKHGTAEFEIL